MYRRLDKILVRILIVSMLWLQACGHTSKLMDSNGTPDSSAVESSERTNMDTSDVALTIIEDKKENADSKEIVDKKENVDNKENMDSKENTEKQENIENSESDDDMTLAETKDDFYITTISDEIFARMKGKSYKDECNVPIEDLRYIHVLHKDLEGNTLEGEMVCHEVIAQDLLEIFEELYLNNYPIERMVLVDDYDADDEASMTANNSSCFNYRCVSHTTKISKHGLGIAVDINPLYNPYTKIVDGTRTIEPAAGAPYLDRDADFPYKIDENDLCYKLFIEHGFTWGGSWSNSKDYQHFEMPDAVADELRAKYQ